MLLKVPGARWALQRWFRLSRSMTLGVRVMLIDNDNRVLLVRHGYAHGWHLPGGGVETGESLLTAVTREAQEEAGAVFRTPPQLHAIYSNFVAFPGDHVALYISRDFVRLAPPAPTFEIQEQAFFAREELPAETTDGTRHRIAEVFDNAVVSEAW
jgi:ADP-ribose pyrophosphatase YjhB (NUDIX family)